jgi:hypothetical protein
MGAKRSEWQFPLFAIRPFLFAIFRRALTMSSSTEAVGWVRPAKGTASQVELREAVTHHHARAMELVGYALCFACYDAGARWR